MFFKRFPDYSNMQSRLKDHWPVLRPEDEADIQVSWNAGRRIYSLRETECSKEGILGERREKSMRLSISGERIIQKENA